MKGPRFTVDTACSSSLVALNQACEAIAAGVIDTAIVAGVNILGTPFPFGGFSRAYMLSGTGRCRAFDADGDGYVRGEGAVAIVIQSAEAARRSNRRVHADIAGWGTNSDGRTLGLSMPSSESQFRLLQQVYGRFELDPNDLAFVEAHGTGTRVGDPAEANAIGKSLGARRDAPFSCARLMAGRPEALACRNAAIASGSWPCQRAPWRVGANERSATAERELYPECNCD